MSASEALENNDFKFLQKLIYTQTGIVIGDHKKEMIYRRLSRRMRDLDIEVLSDYCGLLRAKNDAEMNNFINAVTTNLTSFFRENHHFEFLKNYLQKDFKAANKKRLRLWSSACSTGEEPYSLAITLKQALGDNLKSFDAKILATDLDTQVIQTGYTGIYDYSRIKDLSSELKSTWFKKQDESDKYTVDNSLKSLITFNQLNLLGEWPMKGRFDVIFCRNVFIYFDKPTQEALVQRFYDVLEPNGLLMLGHSESVLKGSHQFDNLGKTIYQRKGV